MLALLLSPCALQAANNPFATPEEPVISSATVVETSTETVISSEPVKPEPYVSPLGKKKTRILSDFGPRKVPTDPTKTEVHQGVDFRVTPGQPVRAACSGKVIFAGFSTMYVSRANKNEKSRLVILQHADGRSTRYVHLNTLKVKPREMVTSGQLLGTAAPSDEWTEPVLHFEIREANGKALDPEELLSEAQ